MPGDVGLEELEEREVARAGDAEEVGGGILGGDGGNVGIAVLDGLAGEVLEKGLVVAEVVEG